MLYFKNHKSMDYKSKKHGLQIRASGDIQNNFEDYSLESRKKEELPDRTFVTINNEGDTAYTETKHDSAIIHEAFKNEPNIQILEIK